MHPYSYCHTTSPAQQHNDYNSLDVVGLLVLFPVFIQLMNLARNVALLLQVKSLKEDKYIKLHLCTRSE